jgi:hypothetical protein
MVVSVGRVNAMSIVTPCQSQPHIMRWRAILSSLVDMIVITTIQWHCLGASDASFSWNAGEKKMCFSLSWRVEVVIDKEVFGGTMLTADPQIRLTKAGLPWVI